MANLDEFVKDILKNDIAAKTGHEAEVKELSSVIADEKKKISKQYTKIGELYYQLHADNSEGQLGKLVAKVKASEKKIKDSKMKIGEVLGFTFCEACGEEVDEGALYCNNCGTKMPVKLMPGMVLCKHCNKAVRENIRFCTNCGKSMTEEEKPEVEEEPKKVCPGCGFTTTDLEMMFCDECGRRLELEGGEIAEEEPEPEKVPTKKVCTNCGFTVFDIETMFCDDCGRRLVEESELNKEA